MGQYEHSKLCQYATKMYLKYLLCVHRNLLFCKKGNESHWIFWSNIQFCKLSCNHCISFSSSTLAGNNAVLNWKAEELKGIYTDGVQPSDEDSSTQLNLLPLFIYSSFTQRSLVCFLRILIVDSIWSSWASMNLKLQEWLPSDSWINPREQRIGGCKLSKLVAG